MEERVFTREELAEYDGKDGRPAYIGCVGRVYDVTGSLMWEGGLHEDEHGAGVDLTNDLDFAPHNDAVLEGFPVVGILGD